MTGAILVLTALPAAVLVLAVAVYRATAPRHGGGGR